MTDFLLRTKLHVPPVRPELVSRPRLIERLDAGRSRKLTLLSAPAGCGKTTLLAEWVARFPDRAAWLSLDRGDDDATRFWRYAIAALQTVEPGLGGEAGPLLQAAQPPATGAVLAALLNQVALLGRQVVLVLDDYHVLSERSIHDGIAYLLEHQPPTLHLVISTRADPPLPTYRLRARGQLAELRVGDLRFTAEEAADFLNTAMGLDLARQDVEALEARTEGWIVGLQLAALSLQGRADAHEFITAFSGGHHYVLEYLTEEVVRRQPEPVQRFLVQTSILDRLCGPLCDAVTGETGGAATLAYLQQRNLFVLPLDDEHRWLRYHHLFADLLGNLLRRERPAAQVRALHLRACEWYDRQGWRAEAVHHALAAGDYERTAALIERHSLAMVTQGELTTLLRGIDALPEEVALSRPWLCIHQAWPLTLADQADAAEPLLQQVERQVPPEDLAAEDEEILAHVASMRAMTAMMRGDVPRAVELARRAEALLPPGNVIPRNTVFYTLASAYYAQGDLGKAGQAQAEVLELARAADNTWMIVRTLCDLADLEMIRGRLGEASDLCHQALHLAEARGAGKLGTVGYARVKLGEILYERDDLAAACDQVAGGVELMHGWRQPFEKGSGYATLALVLQALGDAQGAREALHDAEAIRSRHLSYYKLNSAVDGCRVRLCLAQDGPEAAAHLAAEIGLGQRGPVLFREQEQTIVARVLVARQRPDEALDLLAPLARGAQAGGRFERLIEIRALEALARQQGSDAAGALAALERALALGEPGGYVRVFVDGGAPIAGLLQQAAARGVAPEYVRGLLEALGEGKVEAAAAPAPPGAPTLVEPLTPRELEVLHLLGEGRSNREIAETLVITLNGVKKHNSNLYGKLGVHSRTQAVVRAQELGLL